LEKKWLSDDPGVLELLKDGNEIFELRTAERIFAEHYEELDLNKCPICGNLARTPTAKQCRYCGHDWH
jgi:rubrerythrin